MGSNTTVIVRNDSLVTIESDPMFGKKLADAIRKMSDWNPSSEQLGLGHCKSYADAIHYLNWRYPYLRNDISRFKSYTDIIHYINQLCLRPACIDVSACGDINVASVIETHHTDWTTLVAIGGNIATPLIKIYEWQHGKREVQVMLLKELADKLGFSIIEKPTAISS